MQPSLERMIKKTALCIIAVQPSSSSMYRRGLAASTTSMHLLCVVLLLDRYTVGKNHTERIVHNSKRR